MSRFTAEGDQVEDVGMLTMLLACALTALVVCAMAAAPVVVVVVVARFVNRT